MSKFNSYAKKVDEIAKAAFEEYRKADRAYKTAVEKAEQYPQRHGFVAAEYEAKAARARADLLDAQRALEEARRALAAHISDIAALRKELSAALDGQYVADPAALDGNTLELLKSGILKSSEYARLMNKAQSEGNHTMARLIAKYAGDAAAEMGSRYGASDPTAMELRAISRAANQDNGNETLQAFDVMADLYNRTANNPLMIDHWDELIGGLVKNF